MLVEPVTRIVTPSGPSVAGGNVGTPPTSYLPDVGTPPISEAMGVYEPAPVPSMTSQPLTVSSGPVPSHFSLRLAPTPQVLPAVTLPPVTYAVPGASVGSVSVPPVTSAPFTAPKMMPGMPGMPPMPFPFTKEFHFTAEPRSPQSPQSPPSPILQERRSLASQRAGRGKLQDMAADVEKLSQGQAQLRSEFEALKQMARSQSESVEQLKGMDPTGPTRVWTPRKPFGERAKTGSPGRARKAGVSVTEEADRERPEKGWDESVADCLLCGK